MKIPTTTQLTDRIQEIIGTPFELCEIPAGNFIFGNKIAGNGERRLRLPAFAVAKYPITYDQFQVFLNAVDGFFYTRWWEGLQAGQKHSQQYGEQKWKNAFHPCENVSWYDAIAFCRWLSAQLGSIYDIDKILDWSARLPTEFEWEKAARGTDGRLYPYGNTYDKTKLNNRGLHTTPVDAYPQGGSPFNVQDMGGNVLEWCLSDFRNPKINPSREILDSGRARVARGGGFLSSPRIPSTAYRLKSGPQRRKDKIGFRIVCAIYT